MSLQTLVEEHAARISSLTSEFEVQVDSAILHVSAGLANHLHMRLTTNDGVVETTHENSQAIRETSTLFKNEVQRSGYYEAVQAFGEHFAVQIDDFRQFYEELRRQDATIPEFYVTSIEQMILVDQGAKTVESLNSVILETGAALSLFFTRVNGGQHVVDIVLEASEIVRKIKKVVPMARDLLTTFFRLIGDLVYGRLAALGFNVRYQYVGPHDAKNREFCADLLLSTTTYTRAEIDVMDNGQIPGVFDSAGGHGCRHWWLGVVSR